MCSSDLFPSHDKGCTQPLKVYTNADKVEVFLNGKSLGVYPVADKVVSVDIPFVNGKNVVDAVIEKEGLGNRTG